MVTSGSSRVHITQHSILCLRTLPDGSGRSSRRRPVTESRGVAGRVHGVLGDLRRVGAAHRHALAHHTAGGGDTDGAAGGGCGGLRGGAGLALRASAAAAPCPPPRHCATVLQCYTGRGLQCRSAAMPQRHSVTVPQSLQCCNVTSPTTSHLPA
eukprot:1178476-Prorocentrum_minimum.AAC.4